MFPKVPCDRPTFAATRGFSVPPRAAGRDCVLTSVLALGGCAGLGATGARFDASSLSADPTLLVTTTRKPVNGGRTKPWFGPERASTMTIARAKLVPPDDGRFSLAAVGLARLASR